MVTLLKALREKLTICTILTELFYISFIFELINTFLIY